MSSSLKQLIYNALIKASTPEHGAEQVEYATPEQARDAYIALVMAELFPEEKKEAPAPKSPKKTKEQKEAEKAAEKAAKEAAKEAEKAAKEAAKVAEKAAKEAEKAAAKEAAKAAKEAEKAAKAAEKSPKKAEASQAAQEAAKIPLPPSPPEQQSPKKKAVRKPKAEKPAADANVQKIDPTWRKTLKEAADKDKAKELEPELLKYLNNMSNIAFNSKGARDHVADFLASLPKPAEEPIEAELQIVEFNGKEYYVNPETKRVYEGEMDEDGVLKVTRPVGYVGMADFKDLTL